MAISLMTDKRYLIADFYQELCSSKSNTSEPSISSPEQSFIPQITMTEVEVPIQEIKDKNAPETP